MRHPLSRTLTATLAVLLVAPEAIAQHVAKAIREAGLAAGILDASDQDLDAKARTLMFAFDPGSPLDALQKLVMIAKSAPLKKNGRGDVSIGQLCAFYEKLKGDPEFINSPDWKNFQRVHGSFLEYLLYNKKSCGSGPIQSLIVQNAPDGRYVWIKLKGEINYSFPGGNYRATGTNDPKAGQVLRFRVSDKPSNAIPLMSKFATDGMNFEDLFKKVNTNRVRQNLDAQEVATAMTHIQEGALTGDRLQIERTLKNYEVTTITPVAPSDNMLFRAKGAPLDSSISEIALIAPHGMAEKHVDGEAIPFHKGIAIIRAYDYNGHQLADGRVGQVQIPPTVKSVDPTWQPVVTGSLESVQTIMEDHYRSIRDTGIGVVYGDTSPYSKMTDAQKGDFAHQHGIPGKATPVPRETSCVGWVLRNLEQGYKAAGKEERWKEIIKIVAAHDSDGSALIAELKKDGWTTLYFNPDETNPATSVEHPSKPADEHLSSDREARRNKTYMQGNRFLNGDVFPGVPIDDYLTNYRRTNPSDPVQNEALERFRKAPFFVGIANGAYHVFLGSQGNVIDSHTIRDPTDPTNIEIRPFTEWGLLKGESYLSGVIAIPPGGWVMPPVGSSSP